MKRRFLFRDSSTFQGFDINIDDDDRKRIDQLVDTYEKNIITHIDKEYIRSTSWSDKLADRIAKFGGSWTFIVSFFVVLILWITINTISPYKFDKFPYILLNLFLSFIASFQAPVIMMSQNRQAMRDKHESVIDFAINYKAEKDIDDMQSDLHRIEDRLISIERYLRIIHSKIEEETNEDA